MYLNAPLLFWVRIDNNANYRIYSSTSLTKLYSEKIKIKNQDISWVPRFNIIIEVLGLLIYLSGLTKRNVHYLLNQKRSTNHVNIFTFAEHLPNTGRSLLMKKLNGSTQ